VTESDARFEFRCWARNFGMVDTRLRRLSDCHGVHESDEIYIVAAGNDGTNTKIRGGNLDIKVLTEKRGDLERWRPQTKCEFPVAAAALGGEVLPQLGVAVPRLSRESYALDQFLAELVLPHWQLAAAAVFKRRFAFTVNGCMAELDEVWINGAGLHTVAIEATDPAAVSEARLILGLDSLENVSYVRAIKRVIGMEPLKSPY
jgi:hypothetical protein